MESPIGRLCVTILQKIKKTNNGFVFHEVFTAAGDIVLSLSDGVR